jgi:ribosomal protein L29
VQLGILAPTQELEATLVIRELREEIARWKTQEDTDAASA